MNEREMKSDAEEMGRLQGSKKLRFDVTSTPTGLGDSNVAICNVLTGTSFNRLLIFPRTFNCIAYNT